MNRRLPIIATILVGIAVATMLALGIWQLDRSGEKQAQIAAHVAARDLPPIALPRVPVDDSLLFRRAEGLCLEVADWRRQAGRNTDGEMGWRLIARCRTGMEGPGIEVEVGVAAEPDATTGWTGGPVSGVLTHAPDHHSLFARMLGRAPPRELMLVLDSAPPGLATSRAPDPASVPNNHIAYAGQWFAFAGIALVIYLLALRRRRRDKDAGADSKG